MENAPQDEVAVENKKLNINYHVLVIRYILYYTRQGQRSEVLQRSHREDPQIRRRGNPKESEGESRVNHHRSSN